MPPSNTEKQTKIVNEICCYASILSNATNFDENVEEKKMKKIVSPSSFWRRIKGNERDLWDDEMK